MEFHVPKNYFIRKICFNKTDLVSIARLSLQILSNDREVLGQHKFSIVFYVGQLLISILDGVQGHHSQKFCVKFIVFVIVVALRVKEFKF